MRTRTRILIFLGLLTVAVGVVLVRSFRTRPIVDIGFARYTDDGVAVLNFTNRGAEPVQCASWILAFGSEEDRRSTNPLSLCCRNAKEQHPATCLGPWLSVRAAARAPGQS